MGHKGPVFLGGWYNTHYWRGGEATRPHEKRSYGRTAGGNTIPPATLPQTPPVCQRASPDSRNGAAVGYTMPPAHANGTSGTKKKRHGTSAPRSRAMRNEEELNEAAY